MEPPSEDSSNKSQKMMSSLPEIEDSPIKKKSSKISFDREKSEFKDNKTQLPHLILNNKLKSSSYRRLARSEDFERVKASPLATRLIYNWRPVERQPTRVVQAKVKVYKPPKRIEMPARPSSPYKLFVDYETKDPHAQNHERTMSMKRLQYLRQHTEWSIFPYAAIEEREEYK